MAFVVSDAEIDPDRYLFSGIDTNRGPFYSVSTVARVFFGRGGSWLRQLCPSDLGFRSKSNARRYSLTDIELVAHYLATQSKINGTQLRNALIVLKLQGRIYGYL